MFTRILAIAVACAALALTAGVASLESGCATTAQGQAAVTVLVDVAVGETVQKGTKDPAVMAQRASQIVLIATQLKALDGGVIATLPLVTAALQPLLVKANFGPAELLAANVLVGALSQVIQAQVSPTSTQTAAIQAVLQSVIDAASLYVPTVTAK